MEKTAVQKLAGVLKILVTITFVCNLAAFFFVPGMSMMRGPGELLSLTPYENPLEVPLRLLVVFAMSWGWVWQADGYSVVLTLFLLFCGVCTAVILWQGRRVLGTILAGSPFQRANGVSLRRAGACCFAISAAALARLIWGLAYYRTIEPLLSYNALFVPVFLLGGLLCLVVSALFRQAAELKAENDLTI